MLKEFIYIFAITFLTFGLILSFFGGNIKMTPLDKVKCSNNIGDLNGDNQINENDLKLMNGLKGYKIYIMSNKCCIDIDKNNLFDENDYNLYIESYGKKELGQCPVLTLKVRTYESKAGGQIKLTVILILLYILILFALIFRWYNEKKEVEDEVIY